MIAPDPEERARLYLRKMEPAIAGNRGHDSLFKAACAMVRNFDLGEETTVHLLLQEYNPSCDPPWSERDIRHKVRSALKHVGERGVLIDTKDQDYRRWFSRSPVPAQTRPAPPTEPLNYPPSNEIKTLWERALPAFKDLGVSSWLSSRGLYNESPNLCRALPSGQLPPWASYGKRSWVEAGYRALIPMWNARGALTSLRARSINGNEPKAVPPKGYQLKGLVMANSLARQLLAGDDVSWWGGERLVIIAEGEPSWLTWATEFSDDNENAPAVFGIVAGSWTQEIAARVPSGCKVVIRTDVDQAGQKYAEIVGESLASRCRVIRKVKE